MRNPRSRRGAASAGFGRCAEALERRDFPSGQPLALSQVQSWAYQLQQVSDPGAVAAMASSPYDLVVMEPTRTAQGAASFDTRSAVAQIQAAPAHDGAHRKSVFAYVDVGEAENWRWYWSWSSNWPAGSPRPADWPSYIIKADPDGWSGNFPVAYWDPAWQDVMIYGLHTPGDPARNYASAVQEAVLDGFDGIYLDWVEGFQDPDVAAAARQAGVDPAQAMVQFIGAIRSYARAINPNFQIIQQNGAALLNGHPELLGVVDGIAQESLWYTGQADAAWDDPRSHDIASDPNFTQSTIAQLNQYEANGKPVFAVVYTVDHANQAYLLGAQHGFVTYCSRSSLSRLSTSPPPGLPQAGGPDGSWTADERFVDHLYVQFLGRHGGRGEVDSWTALLPGLGRSVVVGAIVHSHEANVVLVNGYYRQFLNRAADQGGIAAWSAQLDAGARAETIVAQLLNSTEYARLAASPASAHLNADWVGVVYAQLLGRTPSAAEVQFWVGALGSNSRTAVASAFLGSSEYRERQVRGYYDRVLGRPTPPGAGEVSGWVGSPLGLVEIVQTFALTDEFYARS